MRGMTGSNARNVLIHSSRSLLFTLALVFLVPGPASAQDRPPAEKWKASVELGYVVTGGNTSTSTFTLGTNLSKKWDKNTLAFKTYILRSNSTAKTRTAVGTETDFSIVEESVERLVAENYVISGQYDRSLTRAVNAEFGMSWDRNRFAGIGSRFMLTAGTGYPLIEKRSVTLKADTVLSLTMRRYMGDTTRAFAGFRIKAAFEYKFSEKSGYASTVIFDDNLKKTVDWRLDWTNSVSAPLSKSLALKTSLRMLYSHFPATESVALYGTDGTSLDVNVLVPLKKLDVFFTNSLVISF